MKFHINIENAESCAVNLSLATTALPVQACRSVFAYTAGYDSWEKMLQGKCPAQAPALPLRAPRGVSDLASRAEPVAIVANRLLSALRQVGGAPWLDATIFGNAAEEDKYGHLENGFDDLVALAAKVGLYSPNRADTETLPLQRMEERAALAGDGTFLALMKTSALQLSEADVAWTESETFAYYGYVLKPDAPALPRDVARWVRRGEPGSEEIVQLLAEVRSRHVGGISEDGQFVRLQQSYVMCAENEERIQAAVGVDFDILVHREKSNALVTVRLCGGMTSDADDYDQGQMGEAIYYLLHHPLRALSWAMVGARDVCLDILVTTRSAHPSGAVDIACSELSRRLRRSALFGRQWTCISSDGMEWGEKRAELDREIEWKSDAKPGLYLELAGLS